MLFSAIAVGVLFASSAAIATAQIPNPPPRDVERVRQEGPCRDPWITIAIEAGYSRRPKGVGDWNECSPALYNNGSWSSYDQLYRAIVQSLNGLSQNGITFRMDPPSRGAVKLSIQVNGAQIGSGTVAVVSQGGGNVVASGGGNLITSDGAGIISHDGGTFVVGGYSLQSVSNACKKVPIGGGKYFVVRSCR
jgi:hypothetical protein